MSYLEICDRTVVHAALPRKLYADKPSFDAITMLPCSEHEPLVWQAIPKAQPKVHSMQPTG
jgi:hypothetical protein